MYGVLLSLDHTVAKVHREDCTNNTAATQALKDIPLWWRIPSLGWDRMALPLEWTLQVWWWQSLEVCHWKIQRWEALLEARREYQSLGGTSRIVLLLCQWFLPRHYSGECFRQYHPKGLPTWEDGRECHKRILLPFQSYHFTGTDNSAVRSGWRALTRQQH